MRPEELRSEGPDLAWTPVNWRWDQWGAGKGDEVFLQFYGSRTPATQYYDIPNDHKPLGHGEPQQAVLHGRHHAFEGLSVSGGRQAHQVQMLVHAAAPGLLVYEPAAEMV